MIQYSETLNQCKAQFAPTPEFSTLINYRMRENRLTMDDKLRVAKTIEHTYAPLLNHLKADAPSLSDSDMLFCILSTLNIENIATAEMLAISVDSLRVRKYRLRDKLPQQWYDLFFTDAQTTQDPTPTTNPTQIIKPNIIKSIRACFKNYLNTTGRSRRCDYWTFMLFAAIVYEIINISITYIFKVSYFLMEPDAHKSIRLFFYSLHIAIILILTPPMYTATVRRLHDLNLKGWLAIILTAIPVVIILIVKIANWHCCEWLLTHADVSDTEFSTFMMIHMGGNYVLIMFLIINMFIFAKSGTVGPNDYGPDPLRFLSQRELGK